MFLALPAQALAICFSFFGCEPKTEGECINLAGSARTEAAAKAQIAECKKLPRFTLDECRKTEKVWANYLTARGGVEYYWTERSIKEDCKKHYPDTFAASLWVTKAYCEQIASRLSQIHDEIDVTSLRSVRINNARRKIPQLAYLNDWQVVDLTQKEYYKDMLPEEVAAKSFIDAPPDPLAVEAECQKLSNAPLEK